MTEERECDLVILFSGGADSLLMLKFAHRMGYRPYCILIDYEQLHREELEYAIRLLNDTEPRIPFQIVKLHGLKLKSGLTSGDRGTYDSVHEMHVPSRNLMFISIAASIAESKGIDTIWYGADWSDYLNEFPDCKQEWVGRVNRVLQINGPKPIKLEAPLLGLSKEKVVEFLAKGHEVDLTKIFTGYGEFA